MDAAEGEDEEGHGDEDEEQGNVEHLHTVLLLEGDTGVIEILLLSESDDAGVLMDFPKHWAKRMDGQTQILSRA